MNERRKILVVDDEPLVLDLIRDMLESPECEVATVRSGAEALAELQLRPYAVLLSDMKMPGMTGLELACRLIELRPDLPIVLYTGYGDNLHNAELERCGVQAVLPKPVDPAALRALLMRMLMPSAQATG